jgi:eukaryotic translation initiation factor 2C
MLINVDISTATMYKPGSLIDLALDFFGRSNPNDLAPARGLPDRERLRLQRFITGIRVLTPTPDGRQITRIIKKISPAGAGALSFKLKEGGSMTVAEYFKNVLGSPLRFPEVLCVEVDFGIPVFFFYFELISIRSGLVH